MNRVKLITFLVFLGLIPQYAFSDKILLNYKENSFQKKKQHPAEQYLSSVKKDSQNRSSKSFNDENYNKLLIILVGFQEEITDDPNTTGNGQFQIEVPDNYPIQLSKPPHNQEFFDTMAEAMKYYYSATSLGGFNLEWDIYPKDKECYTLSEPMGYYNPPGASNEKFIAKMEEYFKESFETADSESPEIVFSDYAHYMIIHAGSDWQHDVVADTPSDIPSFFIRVGDGKEAVVDNNSFIIDYACNVPETITQDVREYNFDGDIQVSGYGALNGVMFHEFGHSLGLVDLYAVNSNYPMVGTFDIMDSGGATQVAMLGSSGEKAFSIEGLIPALPGGFSRVLMFEESFRERGILKDIENLSSLQDIKISCAEKRYVDVNAPYIYKLNLSQDEYILIENRNVDPDGDGGTAVFSALDNRIALYPTAYSDDLNIPTLEYDYLLPSFINLQGEAIGGGILVWKVNNDVLYNQGSYDSNGNFTSNFDSNFINTDVNNRGVEIIEADAIPDIGNVYAYWWKGTAFEYYFKYMPIFENYNGNQFFAGWSSKIHNTKLNATSTPPLMTSSGVAHSSGLYNISIPDSVMTFSYGSPILTRTTSITSERVIVAVSPIFEGTTKLSDIAVIHHNDIDLYYFDNNENNFNLSGSITLDVPIIDSETIFPVQKIDFENDDNAELVLFYGTRMLLLRNNIAYTYELNYTPTAIPQLFENNYYIPVEGKVLEVKFENTTNSIEITDIDYNAKQIIASDTDLFFITSDSIINYTQNTSTELPGQITSKPVFLEYNTAETVGDEEVIRTKEYIILKTDDNKIFSYQQNNFKLIYDYSQSINQATTSTQLALDFDNQEPYVIFATGNKVYANYLDGTFPLHFPRTFQNHEFSGDDEIVIFDNSFLNSGESTYYGKTIYLPIDNNNYLGWNTNQDIIDPSLNIVGASKSTVFSYSNGSEADSLGYYFQINCFDNSVVLQWVEKNKLENPILWETNNQNPNRNLVYESILNGNQETNNKLSAYVFPNPVASNQATVRIFNIKDKAKLKIFSISGKLIKEAVIETNNLSHVDTVIDFSKITSGVYIGIVEENSTYKFKFAVTK